MSKIKVVNDEGEQEEVEMFTEEEINTKIEEIKTEYDGKITEKDTALETLADEKKELEDKIGDTKEDAPNFKVLKEALDKKDDDIKSLRGELESDRKSRKDNFVSNLITTIAKDDEELKKKIQHHLENSVAGMKEDTDENLKKKIEAAVKLSNVVEEKKDIFDGGIQGGGAGNSNNNERDNSGVEFTAREKALGEKLGISAEDYKKYGSKVN